MWVASLLLFAALALVPSLRTAPAGDPRVWPLGASLLVAWTAQVLLALQTLFSKSFSRAEKKLLMGKFWTGRGYANWRDLVRAKQRAQLERRDVS
jgi:hypothetical protein